MSVEKEIYERLELVNKRIDDNKTLITTVVSSATAIFAVIAIIFTWNVNTEKEDLKSLKQEVKDEVESFLGKRVDQPELNIFSTQATELQDSLQVSKIEYFEHHQRHGIPIPIVLRNDGKAPTGYVALKVYTKKDIELWGEATFEPRYYYEASWQGEDGTGIPDLPGGGFSYNYQLTLWPENIPDIPNGEHDLKLEIYYGKGKKVSNEFRVSLTNPFLVSE
jgi:hypothetical protein